MERRAADDSSCNGNPGDFGAGQYGDHLDAASEARPTIGVDERTDALARRHEVRGAGLHATLHPHARGSRRTGDPWRPGIPPSQGDRSLSLRACAGDRLPGRRRGGDGRRHSGHVERPIACGGVAVFPGDVLAGDGDGVVVIPRAKADEVAVSALEREELETFVLSRVKEGSAIPGTYPPNEETRQAFQKWRQSQRRM